MWMQCRALGRNLKVFLWVIKHSTHLIYRPVFARFSSEAAPRPFLQLLPHPRHLYSVTVPSSYTLVYYTSTTVAFYVFQVAVVEYLSTYINIYIYLPMISGNSLVRWSSRLCVSGEGRGSQEVWVSRLTRVHVVGVVVLGVVDKIVACDLPCRPYILPPLYCLWLPQGVVI